jgi:eukaryotic-like serine/threonine-protein kinase
MRPAEGTSLADGRYTIERHLGSGGMASVWLARDERLERAVAIKLMADTLADDERWLARFTREARAAAALSHPNIVKVFDFGVEDHRPYLVMAYVPGGSLRDRLRDGGPLPEPEALARELLGALGHVHAAGIVHRDVKPGNILLDEDERSHLTDFGIARPQDATTMTQTGMVLGTMRYLAPEVAEGEPATERSDLYAAGGVIREVAGEDPEPALAALLDALTEQEPERRPASAEDALASLDEEATTHRMAPVSAAREQPATAATTREQPAAPATERRDDAPRERAGEAVRRVDEVIRRPWFLPAAGLAAVVLLAVIMIALAGGGDAPQGGTASPAPASAPLDAQLRSLDRAIDAAAAR